jgi:hypothetical protein
MLRTQSYVLFACAGDILVAVAALAWYVTGSRLLFVGICLFVVLVALLVGSIRIAPRDVWRSRARGRGRPAEPDPAAEPGASAAGGETPPTARPLLLPSLLFASSSIIAMAVLTIAIAVR